MRIFKSLLVIYLMAILFSCNIKKSEKTNRPNILVLMSDNHYFEHFGCYGDNIVKTPTIDKFHRMVIIIYFVELLFKFFILS